MHIVARDFREIIILFSKGTMGFCIYDVLERDYEYVTDSVYRGKHATATTIIISQE